MKTRTISFIAFLIAGISAHAQTPQDCPNCDLHGRNYSGQNLTNVNFSYANLDNANFSNCMLNGAMFDNASLQGANFTNAQLNPSAKGPANFSVSNCSHAIFKGASTRGAIFFFANMNGTSFNDADMTDAKLGLRLRAIGTVPPVAPSFTGAIVPCSFKRFAGYADLSKSKFPKCQPTEKSASPKVKCDVYVSSAGTDDDNCGSPGHPCQTTYTAVQRAPNNGVIGFTAEEFDRQGATQVYKNLEFVGGLDDQDQWQPTEYPTLLRSGGLGAPILNFFSNFKMSMSNFILNGDDPSLYWNSYILVVHDGATVSLSHVNLNAGGGGPGRAGTTGIYWSNTPIQGCGRGGKASTDTTGHMYTFGWVRGAKGGTGTGSDNDIINGYCGLGGEMGGASIGISVFNARLEVDNTVTIVGARGGDGGNGGPGVKGAGGGAGGNGAPSFCLVLAGTSTFGGTPIFYAGMGGDGGTGGTSAEFNSSQGCYGHAGENGLPNRTGIEVFHP